MEKIERHVYESVEKAICKARLDGFMKGVCSGCSGSELTEVFYSELIDVADGNDDLVSTFIDSLVNGDIIYPDFPTITRDDNRQILSLFNK